MNHLHIAVGGGLVESSAAIFSLRLVGRSAGSQQESDHPQIVQLGGEMEWRTAFKVDETDGSVLRQQQLGHFVTVMKDGKVEGGLAEFGFAPIDQTHALGFGQVGEEEEVGFKEELREFGRAMGSGIHEGRISAMIYEAERLGEEVGLAHRRS